MDDVLTAEDGVKIQKVCKQFGVEGIFQCGYDFYSYISSLNRVKKKVKNAILGEPDDYGLKDGKENRNFIDLPLEEIRLTQDINKVIMVHSPRFFEKNFEGIKAIHDKIDFKLLLNEHVKIKKGNQELAIVGVENWGRKFGERGDLNLASKGLSKEDFKIVMSHDPSHWDEKIQHDDNHYHLTLSGHTHGFQFGIEIPGWVKWSPVQYVYKQWAGLYENAGRYIYVNRGFGFHAYPGRVGIMPEITVIELKKGEKVA